MRDRACMPWLWRPAAARATGIHFSPVFHPVTPGELAERTGVADHCTFIEHDVRTVTVAAHEYDAVLLLYGQLAVFTRQEAAALLQLAADSLRPGGRLCIELLDQEKVDKSHSTWWFTGDSGLWGDAPFSQLRLVFLGCDQLCHGSGLYAAPCKCLCLDQVLLCDQTYAVPELTAILQSVGFDATQVYAGWNGLPLYDAVEWNVYVGQKRFAE